MWVRKCSSKERNMKLMLQLKALECGNLFSIIFEVSIFFVASTELSFTVINVMSLGL
jgi:hypothetical protein